MNRTNIIKKTYGGILFFIGFILSPLSWWNDLIVNIPLSYLFAIPFGIINKSLFIPMFIVGYWISNIVGLLLMHHGTKKLIAKKQTSKKELKKLIIISILYTLLIVILALIGVIKFPTEYLPK